MHSVTISGSFHRHLNAIHTAIKEFRELGWNVLSPRDAKVVDAMGEFLFVQSDLYRSIRLVENRHLLCIGAGELLWLCAPDGYVGPSAALELGYAIACGKPIYCERGLPDVTLDESIKIAASPRQAVHDFLNTRAWTTNEGDNMIIDPVRGAQKAHGLIDKLAHKLSQPGLVSSTTLEMEITAITKALMRLLIVNRPK